MTTQTNMTSAAALAAGNPDLDTSNPQALAAAPAGTNPPTGPKVPSLADFPTREIFPNIGDALTRWAVITGFDDAAGVRPFITGLTADAEGNATIDPAAYPDSHEVMIAKLTELGDVTTDAKGEKVRGATRTVALVLHPIPKVETFLGLAPVQVLNDDGTPAVDDDGAPIMAPAALPAGESLAELREIIRKEMQHRAVRPLRILKGNYADESAVAEAQDKMPQTLAEYISGTRTGSGLLDAFNKHAVEALDRFKKLDGKNKAVGEAFTRANLKKATLRQALSNAAYASSEHGRLESAGLFVRFIHALIAKAKQDGLSIATYEAWLETRDAQTYDPSAIDMAALDLGDLFAEDSTEAADAAEPTEPTPDAA